MSDEALIRADTDYVLRWLRQIEAPANIIGLQERALAALGRLTAERPELCGCLEQSVHCHKEAGDVMDAICARDFFASAGVSGGTPPAETPVVLPNDEVCACLYETGSRQVHLYARCDRCGAFMAEDAIVDDLAAAVARAEAAGDEIDAWKHAARMAQQSVVELRHAETSWRASHKSCERRRKLLEKAITDTLDAEIGDDAVALRRLLYDALHTGLDDGLGCRCAAGTYNPGGVHDANCPQFRGD